MPMLDISLLRKDLPHVIAQLDKRESPQPFLDVAAFQALESERKTLQMRTEELQAQRNSLSARIFVHVQARRLHHKLGHYPRFPNVAGCRSMDDTCSLHPPNVLLAPPWRCSQTVEKFEYSMTKDRRLELLMKICGVFLVIVLMSAAMRVAAADAVDQAIAVIGKAGPGAAGSADARQARDELAQQGAEILPRLLVAMDTTNRVAANWYRTAFDTIADRELARPKPALPRAAIEAVVRDARRNGRARRLGLTVLERLDPAVRAQWMADWLDDTEFRRDAVDHALRQGDRAKSDQQHERSRTLYDQAFHHARDSDQVLLAVAKLKSVGREVDPVVQMGFIIRWRLLGPFPAPETSGFRTVFPPEQKVDLNAEYVGNDGQKIRWKFYQTSHTLGEVDLIQVIGAVRESVGYAFAEIDSPREQPAQLRCSADDNLSVWLNGRQVLAREQWLNGTRLDRFIVPITLQPGTNQVLVKICQGPQHVNPEVPNNWTFQLRFCDDTGAAVDVRNLLPKPE